MTDLTSLARRVLEAYGGEATWRAARAVEIEFSAGGLAFGLKWQPAFRYARGRFEIAEPVARLDPLGRGAKAGILDGPTAVHLEDGEGHELVRRADPRRYFPAGPWNRRLLYWDDLDQTYFAGYALWNYMVFPALLLRPDIEWQDVGEHVLEARFPPSLPTHCAQQRFHFDPATFLLRQHDYTAEVMGGWAKAANCVLEHRERAGVPYASKRRVTPRSGGGTVRSGPLLIGIEIHDWQLIGPTDPLENH